MQNIEPKWVQDIISRLEAAGFTVTVKYHTDGNEWQDKRYTVTKSIITYLLDQPAQYLLRIAFG